MERLNLNEEQAEPPKPFWRRQFQAEATSSQRNFDWTFGVVLPVACFLFDPIVFKSGDFSEPLLGNFKPFAYLLSFVSVMSMMAFLIWGKKLKWLNAFLAGLFLVGGFISLGVGVVLFPFSVLGLIMLIGILGFTPLFSAFVFLRNSYRAGVSAKPFLDGKVLIHSLALTAILSIVIPSVANVRIKRALNRLTKGNAQTIRYEAQNLKYIVPLVNTTALVNRYRYEKSDEEKQALAEAYQTLTGENIKTKTNRID
jgi:hypothetical protein